METVYTVPSRLCSSAWQIFKADVQYGLSTHVHSTYWFLQRVSLFNIALYVFILVLLKRSKVKKWALVYLKLRVPICVKAYISKLYISNAVSETAYIHEPECCVGPAR